MLFKRLEYSEDTPVLVMQIDSEECKFIAAKEVAGYYCDWKQLPDNKVISNELSFKLDSAYADYKEGK